ncbi:MAG: PadR family transcriptional regulator [Coriobacteriales bacterium]|nr:PadR family transcriptional regulator [Coriobacteriales bacterium]
MGFPITASLLDACVLSMLARGDTYGYELTQNLHESLQVSESTLYPVLRRLQGGEFLRTYDMPHQGRNRRYYAITDDGQTQLGEFREDWRVFRDRLDGFLGSDA